ncbi:2Fe-2S iron-sulfur cluster-binding protein [Bordetella genomosp. 13]|uniref:2Fe-2S ferredoxin-type domain-containing protein n=1 Tax=Bordetella genomosp. 13 TaxID=463040 RepID=A0A1W6ZBQ4_9BORD|nr:hypothetical protein CAL15_10670 [Bordetella genomosp. 13]
MSDTRLPAVDAAEARPAEAAAAAPQRPAHAVTLQPSGWRYDCAEGHTVLVGALRAGIRLPSSCRNGTCRTCMCRMLEGKVAYSIERPGLSPDEKAEGWILPCVAVAQSDLLLEVPNARALQFRPRPPGMLTGARRS